MIRKLFWIFVSINVLVITRLGASADNVRNPLYDLKSKDLCQYEEDNNGKPKLSLPSDIVLHKEDGQEYWVVRNEHILAALQERYDVSLSIKDLLKTKDPKLSLKKLIAPCFAGEATCEKDAVFAADTVRFDGKDEAARMRRALLRLFKAAETGSANGFVVIATDWEAETVWSPDPKSPDPKLEEIQGKYKAINYRPMLNPGLDDHLIGHFIDAAEPASYKDSPFIVLCRGGGSQDAPRVEVDQPNLFPKGAPRIENAITPSTRLDGVATEIAELGKQRSMKWRNNKGWELNREFVLVGKTSDFAKSDADGMEIGLTENIKDKGGEGTDAIKANAAMGLKLSWSKGGDQEKQTARQTFSLTPFIAIDQSAADFKQFEFTETGSIALDENDDPKIISSKVAFAEYSAGFRFDYEYTGAPRPESKYRGRNLSRQTSYTGTGAPGLRIGAIAERFTDNNNNQHGNRIGLEIAPPARFVPLPGYRQSLQLMDHDTTWAPSDKNRKQKRLGLSHWLTGWSVKWDAELAIDYLTYDDAPLDFDTPVAFDRVGDTAYTAEGFNLSLDLSKQGLFGYQGDDGWLELSADYSWRDASDADSINFETPEKWELSAALNHPEMTGLSIGIDYELGQDFKTQKEFDLISLTLKAKY
ncbi:hypothetical protein RYZ27_13355 [Hyphomonas sp. FCG-A18]|uniref:hypothetical protein n=1 Tax=Hyphomonas sp. FCG-A18 TaxID=3080019 RepID=UPI002B2A27CD|nr:hypothetical protein RYZ27_13355 [Hyphomonas sp. FCG-A18]